MTEQVNGRIIDAQPEPRPSNRSYCDTCRWSNLVLQPQGAVMICRRNPPQAYGSIVPINQGGQLSMQAYSQTVWPVIGKDDFCGQHETDAAAAQRMAPAQRLITNDSNQAS